MNSIDNFAWRRDHHSQESRSYDSRLVISGRCNWSGTYDINNGSSRIGYISSQNGKFYVVDSDNDDVSVHSRLYDAKTWVFSNQRRLIECFEGDQEEDHVEIEREPYVPEKLPFNYFPWMLWGVFVAVLSLVESGL